MSVDLSAKELTVSHRLWLSPLWVSGVITNSIHLSRLRLFTMTSVSLFNWERLGSPKLIDRKSSLVLEISAACFGKCGLNSLMRSCGIRHLTAFIKVFWNRALPSGTVWGELHLPKTNSVESWKIFQSAFLLLMKTFFVCSTKSTLQVGVSTVVW